MTFHCMPSLWMERHGPIFVEPFQVTSSGARTFADFPHRRFSP